MSAPQYRAQIALHAGKVVAAFDRQHARDLFDVRDLLANDGFTRPLMDAFLVYLFSDKRPMAKMLAPNCEYLAEEIARTFAAMTEAPVELDALVAARDALISGIHTGVAPAERTVLLGVKTGDPDWSLLGLPQAANLPAVQLRLANLECQTAARRGALADRLKEVLEL